MAKKIETVTEADILADDELLAEALVHFTCEGCIARFTFPLGPSLWHNAAYIPERTVKAARRLLERIEDE